MTNLERYKDATERAEAFWRDYSWIDTPDEVAIGFSKWLDFEAPAEEPLPCPFCGRDVHPFKAEIGYCVNCDHCGYVAGQSGYTMESAIAAHNRVARVVAKEKEANDGNNR